MDERGKQVIRYKLVSFERKYFLARRGQWDSRSSRADGGLHYAHVEREQNVPRAVGTNLIPYPGTNQRSATATKVRDESSDVLEISHKILF